jgi:hypothetical protein
MWSYCLFAALLVLVSLQPAAAAPQDPDQPARARPKDLKDNVKARLVGMKTSEARTRHTIVKFETLGADRKELLVSFGNLGTPGGDTTHVATLFAIFHSCLGKYDKKTDWVTVKDGVEAIFSLPNPEDANSRRSIDFYDRCYLVSLKFGEQK